MGFVFARMCDQRRIRRACKSMKSLQIMHCSHIQRIGIDKGSFHSFGFIALNIAVYVYFKSYFTYFWISTTILCGGLNRFKYEYINAAQLRYTSMIWL